MIVGMWCRIFGELTAAMVWLSLLYIVVPVAVQLARSAGFSLASSTAFVYSYGNFCSRERVIHG
jgi:type II secretory pathway component PulF